MTGQCGIKIIAFFTLMCSNYNINMYGTVMTTFDFFNQDM